MNKNIRNRTFISAGLLISAILLLAGCNPMDWFKGKTGCESCGHDQKLTGEVLLSLNGKPVITVDSYNEFWEDVLNSDPQVKAMAPFMTDLRERVFENLEIEKLIQAWVKDKKIDQNPEYQKKIKRQREFSDRMIAIQAFQEDVAKSIDSSDSALEAFYNENREKNPIFQQPPFVVTAGGARSQAVTFTDEKQANALLAKAQKSGSDLAALARASGKELKDLGLVGPQSRNVDASVKAKILEMQPGSVELVRIEKPQGKGKGGSEFVIVKVVSKQESKYAPFADAKEAVKQVMTESKGQDALKNRIEELKKQFVAKDDTAKAFFEKEKEKQAAELQEKIKAMQAKEKPEGTPAAAQPAATQPVQPQVEAPKAA